MQFGIDEQNEMGRSNNIDAQFNINKQDVVIESDNQDT